MELIRWSCPEYLVWVCHGEQTWGPAEQQAAWCWLPMHSFNKNADLFMKKRRMEMGGTEWNIMLITWLICKKHTVWHWNTRKCSVKHCSADSWWLIFFFPSSSSRRQHLLCASCLIHFSFHNNSLYTLNQSASPAFGSSLHFSQTWMWEKRMLTLMNSSGSTSFLLWLCSYNKYRDHYFTALKIFETFLHWTKI